MAYLNYYQNRIEFRDESKSSVQCEGQSNNNSRLQTESLERKEIKPGVTSLIHPSIEDVFFSRASKSTEHQTGVQSNPVKSCIDQTGQVPNSSNYILTRKSLLIIRLEDVMVTKP
jgi:hypothetical protein